MARKRREVAFYSMSFLDVMSCGFGAVVLLFLIIKHNTEMVRPGTEPSSEVELIEQEIRQGGEQLVAIRNTISDFDDRLAIAKGLADRIQEEISETARTVERRKQAPRPADIETLKQQLRELEAEKAKIESEIESHGQDLRRYAGEGRREYLTGVRLGGKRILVLLDASASMLDDELVNIVRYRNMDDEAKRRTKKWRQAVNTVDWLSARFPELSDYQIYAFNTETTAVQPGTKGTWLSVVDTEQFEDTIERVRQWVPQGGTSLEKAFAEISLLRPVPDNIFLITDGLPTQGKSAKGGMISGAERLRLFWEAVRRVPQGIPMNIILLPMEGDPDAAGALWRLSQVTAGSFVIPTEDWP
jgi:hypothetical protein